MRIRGILAVAAVAYSVACERPQLEAPAETRAEGGKPEAVVAEAKPLPRPDPIRIPGTPHDEEYATIALSWKSGKGKAKWHAAPSADSKIVREAKRELGTPIEFTDSVVMVTKPNSVVAKKGAKIFGASKYNPRSGKTSQKTADLAVPAGETVDVLKYAGEGMCYVRYAGAMYVSGCLDPATWDGDLKKDAEAQWWVSSKAGGWLLVDDAIAVKVETSLE